MLKSKLYGLRISRLLLTSVLLLSVLFFFHTGASASAATEQELTISPASTELSAPPGGSAQNSLYVINSGVSSFNVKIYADPYYVVGVNYNPTFVLLPGKTDASGWVQFTSPTNLSVPASQSQTINYTLNVPPGTAPGGYYAVIFVDTQPAPGAGIASHSRIGDILYITVQGNVVQNGNLKTIPPSKVIVGSTIPIGAEVSDTGGLHFVTTLNIKMINAITDKTIYSVSLQRYVLPQTIRKIAVSPTFDGILALYKIKINANIIGSTQTAKTEWVLIINPLSLIFIPVIIVLVIIYFKLPKRNKKKKKRSK